METNLEPENETEFDPTVPYTTGRGPGESIPLTDAELAQMIHQFPGTLIDLCRSIEKNRGIKISYPYLRKISGGFARKGVKLILDQIHEEQARRIRSAAKAVAGQALTTVLQICQDQSVGESTRLRAAEILWDMAFGGDDAVAAAGALQIGGSNVVILADAFGKSELPAMLGSDADWMPHVNPLIEIADVVEGGNGRTLDGKGGNGKQ